MRYCWKHRSENFGVWMYPSVLRPMARRDVLSSLLVLFSHRPSLLSSSLLTVCHSHATSSNPHRDRKMGVNVNSVSARPRKTAFRRYIKGEQFLFLFFSSFSLSLAPTAISILENFLSLSQRAVVSVIPFFSTFLVCSLVTCQAHCKPHSRAPTFESARKTHLIALNERREWESEKLGYACTPYTCTNDIYFAWNSSMWS